jgi:hypothetical protein
LDFDVQQAIGTQGVELFGPDFLHPVAAHYDKIQSAFQGLSKNLGLIDLIK